jgi:glycosyltransferase involved in cell wall biosynthesis
MAIGSVQRPKGHWLLLDAFARLDGRTRLVLVCGGAGPDYARSPRGRVKRALGLPLDSLDALLRDARARGLADRIVVTGFRRDVPGLLAAADVLAFPSLAAEGFGRPIIEAMAMTRPVVATDVGPSAELLGTEAGLLVPPEAGALADALAELLASPERRVDMGQAGRRRVEACFGLDRQVAQMSAIYGG